MARTDINRQKSRLADLLISAGIDINEVDINRLVRYSELILEWNNKAGLVSKNDINHILERHVYESLLLSLAEELKGRIRLLDIGSGAGLPGIPLNIWNSGIKLVLVESNRKKSLFLKYAAGELGLADTEIITSRIEDLSDNADLVQSFNIVTGRALAPLKQLLNWSEPFLAPDGMGKCLFPKGSRITEEAHEVEKHKWNLKETDLSDHIQRPSTTGKVFVVVCAVLTNT
ncbi:16S rRNA (guanine(527)-N(7))-methyltransferase RsmG [candidate division KSB1 bacterium]